MRRLLFLTLLLATMGVSDCTERDQRTVAARSLGPDAICTWRDSGTSNWEIICISRGVRYTCLVGENDRVSCAATSTPPTAEAK